MITTSERDFASSSSMSSRLTPFGGTRAAQADALLSSTNADSSESESLWLDALESLLKWRLDVDMFDEDYQPSIEILDSAIDYVVDGHNQSLDAPSLITPSGGGRVAFEWQLGDVRIVVEFIGKGQAEFTQFYKGRVVATGPLSRYPESRKIELGR